VNREKRLHFLGNVKLFRGVSPDQLSMIERVLTEKKVKENEIIIEENKPGHEMFILVEGQVSVSHSLTLKVGKNTFADKDKALNFLDAQKYCFFGEIAMIDPKETRTATVTAHSDCELLVFSRDDFERLCESDYKLGYLLVRNIGEEICSRLKKSNTDLLKLTTALSIALSR